MTRSPEPEQERMLLEAVAFAADRLLGPADRARLPEVLVALGEAAAVSRVALVAAQDASGGSPARMEVRHQWMAPGVARLISSAIVAARYAPALSPASTSRPGSAPKRCAF